MQISEFVGSFPEGAKIEVDGNALLRLVNSFLSGQTHRVLEHWATRNLPSSEIEVLAGNLAEYTQKEDGTAPAKQFIMPEVTQPPEPATDAVVLAAVPTGFSEGEIVRKIDGSLFQDRDGGMVSKEAILIQVDTNYDVIYLATPEEISRIWIVESSILKEVETTGEVISETSLAVLKESVRTMRGERGG